MQNAGVVSGVEGRSDLRGNLKREAAPFTRGPRAAHRDIQGTTRAVLGDKVGVPGGKLLVLGGRQIGTRALRPRLTAVEHRKDVSVA